MIGVDEVGRGCLAGPLLVVAARAYDDLPKGLRDSKLLTKPQREELLNKLSISCQFGEGWVKAAEIDRLGLARALRLGIKRSLDSLGAAMDEEIVLDGKVNYLPKKFINGKAVVDADNLIPVVSAASVYAKVTRDRFMTQLAKKYPLYSFERHAGYGTKTHMLALKSHGALKYVHRYSYQPITELTGVLQSKQPSRV